MSQPVMTQNNQTVSSERKARRSTIVAIVGVCVAALAAILFVAFAYDRVNGSWVPHSDVRSTSKYPEVAEPGTLQYGGSNAFPRTDPIR